MAKKRPTKQHSQSNQVSFIGGEASQAELVKKTINEGTKQPEKEIQEILPKDRYSVLSALWSHHNTSQLQWPAIVLGAVLLILSNVISKNIPLVANWRYWGKDMNIILGVGIPLILTGLAIVPMLYTMKRARKIMEAIEKELIEIEKISGIKNNFSKLNHPPGYSGPSTIRLFLMMLSFLMIVFGVLFSLGLIFGGIGISLILLLIVFWVQYCRRKHRIRLNSLTD